MASVTLYFQDNRPNIFFEKTLANSNKFPIFELSKVFFYSHRRELNSDLSETRKIRPIFEKWTFLGQNH